MMIEIYFAESALLRTLKNTNKGIDTKYQTDMTKLYVFNATITVISKSKEVIGNISEDNEQLSLIKSVHRLCKYDKLITK